MADVNTHHGNMDEEQVHFVEAQEEEHLVTHEEEHVDTKSHHQKPNVHKPIANHIC